MGSKHLESKVCPFKHYLDNYMTYSWDFRFSTFTPANDAEVNAHAGLFNSIKL